MAAFGGGVSFPEIGAAYLVAAALGSAAPDARRAGRGRGRAGHGPDRLRHGERPGGVGRLTFRLVTYWLPMLPGWFMFQQMQRREEL